MDNGHVAAAFVPEAALCDVEGVSLVLGALVVMATGVAVYLYVPRNDRTDALNADYRRTFENWTAQSIAAKQRGEPPPDPPSQPIVELFEDMRPELSDDIDTPYRWLGAQMGGSSTEWEATWRFAPAVPRTACRLTVAIGTQDWRGCACVLPL